MCRREWECRGRVGSGGCQNVHIRFHCGYHIRLREDGDAVDYLLLHADSGMGDVFAFGSPPRFSGDEPDFADAATGLCSLGLGCPGDAQPAQAAVPADQGERSFRDCKDGFCAPAMVALPRGRYRRGSTDAEVERLLADEGPDGYPDLFHREQPVHEVVIPLAVGMFEVTAEEWNACVTDEACPPRGRMSGNDRHPVSGVSWLDITQDYLPWLNRKLGLSGHLAYRLPTDAEWEYAARAGTASRYAAGDLLTTREARFLMHDPAPVGSYPPNGFGLHDMAGNAPEWVQDCIRPPYETAPRDGSAVDVSDCDLRIYRDADWHSLPWYMRAASRHLSDQDNVHRNIGFRLARTLAQ